MSDFNVTQPTPEQRPALTENHRRVLNALRAAFTGGTLNVAQAREILTQQIDQFIPIGNRNNRIDASEITFIRDLINAQLTGEDRDTFVPLQQALAQNARQLGIVTTTSSTDESRVNDGVRNYSPNLQNLAGNRLPGRVNALRQIQNNMQGWRQRNAGITFNMPRSPLLNVANSAIQMLGLQDMDRRSQLRALLAHFWNNDPQGIQFINIQEFEAMRQWAMQEGVYGPNGMNDFQRDFNELFIRSIRKDTPFAVDLIANQWAQSAGSSAFLGPGGESFRGFFDGLGQALANEVVSQNRLQPGQVVAGYNGQIENPGFDNILITVGNDGQARIERSVSQHGDTKKIGYHFGQEGQPPAREETTGGGFGAGLRNVRTTSTPPPVASTTIEERLQNLHRELTHADFQGNQSTQPHISSLSQFTNININTLNPQELQSLIQILNNLKVDNLPPNLTTEVDALIRSIQNLIPSRQEATSGSQSTDSTFSTTENRQRQINFQEVIQLLESGYYLFFGEIKNDDFARNKGDFLVRLAEMAPREFQGDRYGAQTQRRFWLNLARAAQQLETYYQGRSNTTEAQRWRGLASNYQAQFDRLPREN